MPQPQDASASRDRAELFDALRKGFLLGTAVLVIALPPVLQRPSAPASDTAAHSHSRALPALPRPPVRHVPRLADFGMERASPEARQVATWALYTGDHQNRSVIVVDKKDAKVFVFDPEGGLKGASPVLLGSAHGDHTVPGVGDKPIAAVLPEERTTPAGRFMAEPGVNANGEDVVWVDYDAAVSMHRVRPNVKAERRLERLASPTPEDNRISYGCINMPVAFYEQVLSPAVRGGGAVIYVLPETTTAAQVFGSYDIPAATQLAHR